MARRRGYHMPYQQFIFTSAARTTSSTSGNLTRWSRGVAAVSSLQITAASGTAPSMVVTVDDSPDGTTWTVRDTYPAQTGVVTVTRPLPVNLNVFHRVSYTITGTTPSFTFQFQFAIDATLLQ